MIILADWEAGMRRLKCSFFLWKWVSMEILSLIALMQWSFDFVNIAGKMVFWTILPCSLDGLRS